MVVRIRKVMAITRSWYVCFSANIGITFWGVLQISSIGEDRKIFFGLIFSIPGLFWVENFVKFFLGVA